jgi:transcriptional regulator with XRE-family HTH domain
MRNKKITENVNWLDLREKSGLTLAQLATISGYSIATINGLELKNQGSDRLRDKLKSIFTEYVNRAERAAGIGIDVPAAPDSPAGSVSDPKESGPVADQFPDVGKMMDLLRDEIAEKNRQIERLLGLLAAALDSRAPEPPPAAVQRPGQVFDPERSARVKG